MDLMDCSTIAWPSELVNPNYPFCMLSSKFPTSQPINLYSYMQEEMEEEARLIHESEWQLEMMRPFQFPPPSSCNSRAPISRSKVISFGNFQQDLKPREEAVSDPVDLIRLAPAAPYKSAGAENIEAERRRREKLTQGFIQLSSLLPNLKKLDKASVLAEAASYLKQLQVQVKSLEEQRSRREARTRVSSIEDRDTSSSISSGENFGIGNTLGDRLLEVEARILEKDVLIKVHCERNQEIFPGVLEEIQKLNLDIINCNAMDFGKYAMVITILAKMNEEFSTTAKNLVRMLQQSLRAHL